MKIALAGQKWGNMIKIHQNCWPAWFVYNRDWIGRNIYIIIYTYTYTYQQPFDVWICPWMGYTSKWPAHIMGEMMMYHGILVHRMFRQARQIVVFGVNLCVGICWRYHFCFGRINIKNSQKWQYILKVSNSGVPWVLQYLQYLQYPQCIPMWPFWYNHQPAGVAYMSHRKHPPYAPAFYRLGFLGLGRSGASYLAAWKKITVEEAAWDSREMDSR